MIRPRNSVQLRHLQVVRGQCPGEARRVISNAAPSKSAMSHHDQHESVHREPDPADSRADAIAAFCAIAIAVCGVLYFISQQ